MKMVYNRMGNFGVILLTGILLCAGCGRRDSGSARQEGRQVLQAWAHAGRQAERETMQRLVDAFNAESGDIAIELTFLPEGSYNAQVQAAALADDLPDLLEFDGPYVYNYVWQNHLVPLDELVSEAVITNVIPSIIKQGTYKGSLYSLGMFDSGLALYGRRSLLNAVGARIPGTPEEAWSVDEFENILSDLAARDDDGRVLDLKLNYRGEWFTYAFMPALVSAGGDLIDREDFSTASGILNGPRSVQMMQSLQKWMHDRQWVDENVDDSAFTGGRVALSWAGHWEYGRYDAAWSNDLVLLPLPDFGEGSRTGQGSWNWGITARCDRPADAARFLEFLLQDDCILAITDANAAVPATRSALAASELYTPDRITWLFAEQLTEGFSVPRPRTPAYPVITSSFRQAFDDIRHGADIQAALDQAVDDINRDIDINQGYPQISGGGNP